MEIPAITEAFASLALADAGQVLQEGKRPLPTQTLANESKGVTISLKSELLTTVCSRALPTPRDCNDHFPLPEPVLR